MLLGERGRERALDKDNTGIQFNSLPSCSSGTDYSDNLLLNINLGQKGELENRVSVAVNGFINLYCVNIVNLYVELTLAVQKQYLYPPKDGELPPTRQQKSPICV